MQLRKLVEPLDARFKAVWPAATKEERRCFELLRGAYNKSRYDRHYRVTEDELRWILAEVEYLCDLTEEVCAERIASSSRPGESASTASLHGPHAQAEGRQVELTDHGRQLIVDYYAAAAANPDPIVDERLLPHSKEKIKAAFLGALREANDLETVRRLTEGFLELSRWLLLNEHDLTALKAYRASAEGADNLASGPHVSGSHLADYGRLANRVAANTIILGAELQRAGRGPRASSAQT